MELLIGCNNRKTQDEVAENLQSYKIVLINAQIISIANEIIKKYSFSNKMSVADNFYCRNCIVLFFRTLYR